MSAVATTETVAVVVVTHNRADLLAGMLDGLAAQTRAPDRVIVIDNGSTDHTGEVLSQRMARTEMPLDVVTQENLGGAGGRADEEAEEEGVGPVDHRWFDRQHGRGLRRQPVR